MTASSLWRSSLSISRRLLATKSGANGASPYESLQQLGSKTPTPASPDEAQLERVPNMHPETPYLARFTCPEFTSICPVTGQPDFAHLVIDYAPGDWLVESKSLKHYLTSFRNHGDFHEACTVAIGRGLSAYWSQPGCGLGDTGTRAGGFRSMFSSRRGRRPRGCGCRSRGCRRIGDAGRAGLPRRFWRWCSGASFYMQAASKTQLCFWHEEHTFNRSANRLASPRTNPAVRCSHIHCAHQLARRLFRLPCLILSPSLSHLLPSRRLVTRLSFPRASF